MDYNKSRMTAAMTLIISLLALFASLKGLLDKNLYTDAFLAGSLARILIPGSLAQDIISIPAGLILSALSLAFLRHPGYKIFIAMLGLTGYFFYGYGLYAMQGQYTAIYLVYLAIFGLSIYSIILGLLSFDTGDLENYRLPGALRKATGTFLIAILLVLTPLWLTFIASDIARHVPRDTYAVFILDLCVVFPALGIIAALLFSNKPFGNILAGIALLKAMTVCLSVAFGEWFLPLYGGYQANYGSIAIFSVLALASLILFILYMISLKKEPHSTSRKPGKVTHRATI